MSESCHDWYLSEWRTQCSARETDGAHFCHRECNWCQASSHNCLQHVSTSLPTYLTSGCHWLLAERIIAQLEELDILACVLLWNHGNHWNQALYETCDRLARDRLWCNVCSLSACANSRTNMPKRIWRSTRLLAERPEAPTSRNQRTRSTFRSALCTPVVYQVVLLNSLQKTSSAAQHVKFLYLNQGGRAAPRAQWPCFVTRSIILKISSVRQLLSPDVCCDYIARHPWDND